MMKIIFTCLSLSMICFAGRAQKIGFGIKAGISFNYLVFSEDGEKEQGQKTGASFGFIDHFQLTDHFAIQPNVLVALKGAKFDGMKIRTWHFEIPINLLYTHNGFFIGGGPNFSYGQDALAKGDDLEPDGEVDLYSSGESPDFILRRFDMGANLLMGYTFENGISLSATYTHGFNNLYKGPDEDLKVHYRNFGFALGYIFMKTR